MRNLVYLLIILYQSVSCQTITKNYFDGNWHFCLNDGTYNEIYFDVDSVILYYSKTYFTDKKPYSYENDSLFIFQDNGEVFLRAKYDIINRNRFNLVQKKDNKIDTICFNRLFDKIDYIYSGENNIDKYMDWLINSFSPKFDERRKRIMCISKKQNEENDKLKDFFH